MADLTDNFVSDELARCNRCGFCIQTCPTYRVTGRERAVARARNDLLRSVVRGGEAVPPDVRDPFYECLLCGACTESCLTSVLTDDLMVRAREAFVAEHGQPAVQRLVFRELLPHPERMARAVRLLALGKSSGLSQVANDLGVLRFLNPKLAAAESLVDSLPRRFFRDLLPELGFEPAGEFEGLAAWRLGPAKPGAPRIGFFVGCGGNFALPQTQVAAVRLLRATGGEVIVLPNKCCGLPAYAYGDREAARALAADNLRVAEAFDCDVIATECGSCSGFLKRYPELLEDASAEAVASRVRDLSEVLAETLGPAVGRAPVARHPGHPVGRGFTSRPEVVGRGSPALQGLRVTYHDPCHMARRQKVTAQPRDLLRAVPGLQFVELPEANWCCGGAGSFNITHHDLSMKVLDRKMQRVAETGAELLVTSCPSCVMQLSHGVRRAGLDVRVCHLAELLADAYL